MNPLRAWGVVEVQRLREQGHTVLFLECPVCDNRLFVTDGFPLSGQEAEEELRAGFNVHVENHAKAGETRSTFHA